MKLYFDSSALVKLVQRESESDSLRGFLNLHEDDQLVSSALSSVEVVRAVQGGGLAAVALAHRVLGDLDVIAVTREILDEAATMVPGERLRSLDAIHVASARSIGNDVRALVTYDSRMAHAARTVGLAVESPA